MVQSPHADITAQNTRPGDPPVVAPWAINSPVSPDGYATRRICADAHVRNKEQTLERRADLKLVIAQMAARIMTIRSSVSHRPTPAQLALCTPNTGRWLQLHPGVSTPFPVISCLNWGSAVSRLLTTGIRACAKACHVVFAMSPPPIGHGFLGCPIPVTPVVKRGSPMARLSNGGCRL
ncbi:hypothetical protein PhaeoP75_00847 [Phaeobacter gallaeciensis]|uniref:Uncharacterized protein n=1 Tax=Phaeobacter gallaeciensis TaxID=60890 RepID=A0AAC9Z7C8_9RHOB|nr:hypothetical protein Gal_00850 [Phaeobacter gallaeciensis DSM 26640]ATE91897.1 hypothetical protein PhaeoP11_00846 [Phaeobacter gallaeciensis]ATE98279.1 hypothetical protein PhaeoP73_02998 [Phaeobacter gallaeciensis]ATF00513.1 hypothetical protein PhaeoP75_00847 [Phaeobacter gallaeciensis]ATF04944.1 hypothetical protein PhaeoP63_00846 [Phaeobacter gallaeciensis]